MTEHNNGFFGPNERKDPAISDPIRGHEWNRQIELAHQANDDDTKDFYDVLPHMVHAWLCLEDTKPLNPQQDKLFITIIQATVKPEYVAPHQRSIVWPSA